VRGSRWVIALKGAFNDRSVVATAFLVVLLAATLVAAIPIYASAVAESSLRERLERAPPTESNVQATVSIFGGSDPQLDDTVEELARDVFSETSVAIFASGESESFVAADRAVVFGFFEDLQGHASLVTGRWPATTNAVAEVVAPQPVARALDLRVGDRIDGRSRLGGTEVSARVVGIYRPERVASAYWWGNPLSTAGASGPLVTTRETFFALGLQNPELTWRIEPQHEGIAIGEASELRRKLAGMADRLNAERLEGQEFDVVTSLPEILAGADRSLRLARAGVLVPSIQLALLAGYGLIVTAALLVERRRTTTESLRLRGATTRQIAGMRLIEAALIALPAVVVAPWLAAASLRALNYVGPLADIDLRLAPRVSVDAYALAAVAALVCILALVVPALRAGRAAVVRERRRLPLARFAQRTHLDLVLVALALLGYWQLRHYHGTLVEHRGALEIDPFLVAAPALLLLAGALLALRLVPLTAALVERFLPSTEGPVAALGFWQLARRPQAYARSVLLLVLAIAIGVFALTYSRTWHRSQVDQAEYAAGADVFVEPSEVRGAPSPYELASAYRELGAEPLPAATYPFDLGRFSRETGTLLAVDARRVGAVLRVREDFASRPLDDMLGLLAAERGSVATLPLPGRPTSLALTMRLEEDPGRQAPPLPTGTRRLPSPSVLYLRDADGVIQAHRLGDLRPGRDAHFAVELARRGRGGRAAQPRYPLEFVALRVTVEAPYLVSERRTIVVRKLELGYDSERTQRVPLDGAPWAASATTIKQPYQQSYQLSRVGKVSTDGGSIRIPVDTGSSLFLGYGQSAAASEVVLRPGRDRLPAALPALASDEFLRAAEARVGQQLPLGLASGSQAIRIVDSVRRFPTLDPAASALVVDLPTYLALNFTRFGAVVQPSQWFLETPNERDVVAQLRAPPFSSLAVTSRTERERALLEDPIPLGVIGALVLGFVVAAVFAAVGFAASAAAAARSRMLEFAVLRSLGLRTRQLSGWISIENGLVVALSLLGGTALGVVVAWLVLPYVALGTSGAPPVPPVVVSVPWGDVLLLELALLGALVLVAALQIVRIRGLRPAPVLRSGEGVVAP
jgi:FtsX-like permease family